MANNELYLGLIQCTFLTCREKEILASNLDNLEDLTVLSMEDICVRVGRRVRTTTWRPGTLRESIERQCGIQQRYGIRLVTVMDQDYPPLLREIHDPPFALFWRGNLPDPVVPVAAIVGTRSPSGSGVLAAERLGREFGYVGIPVVSGLARGIDAFAHRGNLDGGGASIAVLACGPEQIYPKSNSRLAQRLLERGGCLMSEYPPGDPPLSFHFPQRNRIISGLARGVIVVEAPEKSGALITADFALEQGRDLFVVDGLLDSARGKGTNSLHEQGAEAIRDAGELLSDWGFAPAKGDAALVPGGLIPARNGPRGIGRQLALDFRNELIRRENRDR